MKESVTIEPATTHGYALLDAGDARRLERFGGLMLDRPAPGASAPRRTPARWADADLRYDAGRGWSGRANPAAPWAVALGGLAMELRATTSGGVGLYPEHAANLEWLDAEVRARLVMHGRAGVLNLFAHTGLATLAAARAGAAVAHVDAARASVAWARRNAERSGLVDRPIRWLVDDAEAFAERESRRGRRYDGVILDPPSAGHGRAGSRAGRWTLRDDLPRLLAACAAVTAEHAFVLLTAHSTGLTGEVLVALLEDAFPRRRGQAVMAPLSIRAESGASLDLGWAVRLGGPGAKRGRRRASAPDAAP